MRESYGQLYPRFWDGPTGQALQKKGKDAVILAAFLMSNRWASMTGLYELPIEMMLRALPVLVRRRDLERGVGQLSEPGVDYASYDQISGVVWVHEMARIRLQLMVGDHLDPKDKRVAHVVRAYESVKPNAFLARFYDRYASTLNLPRKRWPFDGPPQGPPQAPLEAPSEAPMEGHGSPLQASDQVQSTEIRYRDQDQDQVQGSDRTAPGSAVGGLPVENLRKTGERNPRATAPAADGNYRAIAYLAREILDHHGALAEGDLIEAVKTVCAQRGIDYGRHPDVAADVVHRACTSELFKFRHPELLKRAAP